MLFIFFPTFLSKQVFDGCDVFTVLFHLFYTIIDTEQHRLILFISTWVIIITRDISNKYTYEYFKILSVIIFS